MESSWHVFTPSADDIDGDKTGAKKRKRNNAEAQGLSMEEEECGLGGKEDIQENAKVGGDNTT
jgi:hypothetical protein